MTSHLHMYWMDGNRALFTVESRLLFSRQTAMCCNNQDRNSEMWICHKLASVRWRNSPRWSKTHQELLWRRSELMITSKPKLQVKCHTESWNASTLEALLLVVSSDHALILLRPTPRGFGKVIKNSQDIWVWKSHFQQQSLDPCVVSDVLMTKVNPTRDIFICPQMLCGG